MEQIDGELQGLLPDRARTRRSGRPTARCSASGLANLDWLVVRDFTLIESATWWKDGPEIETGEMRTEDIGTEVFFLPGRRAHREGRHASPTPTGCCSGTTRRSSQPGDCRSDLWFMYHLGRLIRERLAGSTDERDRPVLDLTWDYPTRARTTSRRPRPCCTRSTATAAERRALSAYTELKDDGSTSCGCWIYCGVYADGVNQAARRKPRPRAELGRRRVGLGLAGQPAHPLQPRVGRPRRQAVERAQGLRLVGRRAGQVDRARRPGLRAGQAAGLPAAARRARRRTRSPATDPFIMQADGKGWLFAPAGLLDGPLPTHYEPQDSPVAQPAVPPAAQPGPVTDQRPENNRCTPSRRRRARRVPVRAHDLPADRALHRPAA